MTNTIKETKNRKKKQKLRNNEYYNIQDKFDELYSKSQRNYQFKNLYEMIIEKNNIFLAYRNIKNNTGSKTVGVNNKTISDIADMKEDDVINYVRNRLIDFHPMPVRRVLIPKGDGKTRPLGIPTIEDRLIQQCIKQVLEPICEAKFYNHSYGFRPNRSMQHAIARSISLINRNGLHYVVDIDIKGFFDNVNHSKLLKQMWTLGIKDKRVISIISKLLKAEIEGEGIPSKGTPQGGIISPLLSNIVLNELDWWISSQWENMPTKHEYASGKINKSTGRVVVDNSTKIKALKKTNLKEMYMVRYADDFKIFCRDSKTAFKIYNATVKWLQERLGLQISPEKSKVVNLRKSYSEFLGFKLRLMQKGNKKVVKSNMTNKAKNKVIKDIKLKIDLMRKYQNATYVARYNSTIIGIQNYYKIATHITKDLSEIDFLVRKRLHNRTKECRSKTGRISNLYKQRYGKRKGKNMYVCGMVLFPIAYVQTKPPVNFTQATCNYTELGRQIIHDKLVYVNQSILKYIMENPSPSQSLKFNDNKISLYVGQGGKCKITGRLLTIGDMEVHHVKPKHMGGTDEYRNLIFVQGKIHKLIHVTKQELIYEYLKELNLSEEEITRINKLRSKIGNCNI